MMKKLEAKICFRIKSVLSFFLASYSSYFYTRKTADSKGERQNLSKKTQIQDMIWQSSQGSAMH